MTITTSVSFLHYLLVISAFTFIYLLVTNTKVKFRSALTGAVIAGILWETTGWLFASFVVSSGNYTAVYSSFAILVLFMIWLYLSWLILLIGSSISYYHQHPNKIPAGQNLSSLSNRMKEKAALLIMYHIGKSFHESSSLLTSSELSDILNVSNEVLSDVLHALEFDKLITRHQYREISYLPSQSLENISIIRILESIRRQNETSYSNIDSINSEKSIEDLGNLIDKSIEQSIDQISLRDLISNDQLDK